MEPLGTHLREERRKQGKTLDEIARKTRISRTTLQAIESEIDNEKLPPASYLRGFVKLYAQELGLDPGELLEGMPKQAVREVRVALPRKLDLETPKRPLVKIVLVAALVCVACLWAWLEFVGVDPAGRSPDTIVSPRPVGHTPEQPVVPQTLPLGSASPAGPDGERAPDTRPRESAPVEPLPGSEAAPQPEAAEVGVQPEEMPSAAAAEFVVRFVARGIVWIKMQADKDKAVDITLRKGERFRISAERVLKARLGNPAMLDVWYNDMPVSLAGTPGLPLDVTFPDIVLQSEQRGN